MIKNIFRSALATTALCCAAFTADAALSSSSYLPFDAGAEVDSCPSGSTCPFYMPIKVGSYWAMDLNADSVIQESEKWLMTPGTDGGIILGINQFTGQIDEPWLFFANSGAHQTNSPVTIASDDGNGNVLLNFSGWNILWNTNTVFNLGAGSWMGNPDGQASLKCQNDCSMVGVIEAEYREAFTLDYSATIPLNDPSGFGGIGYQLHLESGTLAAVPVPASIWLLGSGLLTLLSLRRRKC